MGKLTLSRKCPSYYQKLKAVQSDVWKKDEFEETSRKYPYHSFLPDDANPQVEMYHELMTKYRPQMEKFYLSQCFLEEVD